MRKDLAIRKEDKHFRLLQTWYNLLPSLYIKRFRGLWEQRKTEEREF